MINAVHEILSIHMFCGLEGSVVGVVVSWVVSSQSCIPRQMDETWKYQMLLMDFHQLYDNKEMF